ncbi:MAG: 30S ribosomal protein S3 [Acidimicrobiia bacterium]|nr:MAG: 30S ribosomal protein S3 [Acidimicrobiia bacterium]
MGQKSHPYGLRLGIVTDWKSRWYSEKDYAAQVAEDHHIRKYLKGELKRGAISRIDIERIGGSKVQIDVHTGRPGVVIGRGGSEAERLRAGLEDLSGRRVKFNVIEVHNPELDATLLARSVADQLEGRVSFRRALKRTVATALKAGAEGVRVQASGRLGGADMGRREWYLEGRVPLHTLRADIDFGQATAETTVGAIGIKVWVYKGDIMKKFSSSEKAAAEARMASGRPADRKHRKSVKSRAEAAAGHKEKRIIEAGGGKRLIEAGGGKRVTAADGKADLAEARAAVEEPATADKAEATGDEAIPEQVAEVVAEVGGEPKSESKDESVELSDASEPKTEDSDNADDASAGADGASSGADDASAGADGASSGADDTSAGAEVAVSDETDEGGDV